ncbi:Uncharacterized protein HZ326_12047 [Fusarium oxysporum f. sp. albedinis]|nr:Uncharacterized protein HZ326_12047 [Fusarium oxysporum f. sp. albedinis]
MSLYKQCQDLRGSWGLRKRWDFIDVYHSVRVMAGYNHFGIRYVLNRLWVESVDTQNEILFNQSFQRHAG